MLLHHGLVAHEGPGGEHGGLFGLDGDLVAVRVDGVGAQHLSVAVHDEFGELGVVADIDPGLGGVLGEQVHHVAVVKGVAAHDGVAGGGDGVGELEAPVLEQAVGVDGVLGVALDGVDVVPGLLGGVVGAADVHEVLGVGLGRVLDAHGGLLVGAHHVEVAHAVVGGVLLGGAAALEEHYVGAQLGGLVGGAHAGAAAAQGEHLALEVPGVGHVATRVGGCGLAGKGVGGDGRGGEAGGGHARGERAAGDGFHGCLIPCVVAMRRCVRRAGWAQSLGRSPCDDAYSGVRFARWE